MELKEEILSMSESTSSSSSNLILGIVDGLHFYNISVFCESLRRTDFDGHLCLFVGPRTHPNDLSKMVSAGIEVRRYRDPPVLRGSELSRTLLGRMRHPIHMYNFRHILYYEYLREVGSRFENVFLSDVRDVYFQRSPFDLLSNSPVCLAVENENIPIGEEAYTRGWIQAAYGDEVAETLAQHQVICAGTILGRCEQVSLLIESLFVEMEEALDLYVAADQALLNRVVHYQRFSPIHLLYNFRGPILTVGTERDFRLPTSRPVTNWDGSVIKVIHQYDRHPMLARLLRQRALGRLGAWRFLILEFLELLMKAARNPRKAVAVAIRNWKGFCQRLTSADHS